MSDAPTPSEPVLSEVPIPPDLREIKRFVCKKTGRLVEMLTEFREDPLSFATSAMIQPDFIGHGVISMQISTPQGPAIEKQPFKFKIEADTLTQAFDRFQDAANKAVKAMEDEQKQAERQRGSIIHKPRYGSP